MEIYAGAREFMRQTGNPDQWRDDKPTRAQIIDDIDAMRLWVIDEGEIRGVFALFDTPDPTYRIINGEWLNDEPYCTVHRIAAASGAHGTVEKCVEFCRGRLPNLRIDTHRDNAVMQHVLEKNGFRRCGIIWLECGDERIAYQLEY